MIGYEITKNKYALMILKMNNITRLLFGIICLIMVSSCQKTNENAGLSDAIITGYDLRACACCGGLMVTFSTDTTRYSGTFYLVNQLPNNSGIDNNTKFPLDVKISWKFSTRECGSTKFVDVLKIEIE